jgi:hypothetical protein
LGIEIPTSRKGGEKWGTPVLSFWWRGVKVRIKIEIKINVKGNGQECPFRAGVAARGVTSDLAVRELHVRD